VNRPPVLTVPKRFRRRLAFTIVAVAAVASGVLAMTSYFIVQTYRAQSFANQAERQTELALLALPDGLTAHQVEQTLAGYQVRGGFDAIVVGSDGTFTTAPGLDLRSVPRSLLARLSASATRSGSSRIQGKAYLVQGRLTRDGKSRVYFLFDRTNLRAGLVDLRNTLAFGWLVVVAIAGLVGAAVARRTLAPVRQAAVASRSLADGLLETRMEERSGRDEFAVWAEAFNEMAAALQAKIAELSEAARREQRFTADVAHDLRTPLTAMVSAATLLEERLRDVSEPSRTLVGGLCSDTRRLQALVSDLLELTRLDADQERVRLEPLFVEPSLCAAAAPWRTSANVVIDVDPRLCVLADRVRLRRIIANVVSNAFDHGGNRACVTARPAAEMIEIDVTDDGPGIPAEALDLVFDRFFQADRSRSSTRSGLGLAIAFESARVQNGTLRADNVDGGGARFTLSLPRCDPPLDGLKRSSVDRTDDDVDVAHG
jgi:two-component system sensor histidine kinase MtrB